MKRDKLEKTPLDYAFKERKIEFLEELAVAPEFAGEDISLFGEDRHALAIWVLLALPDGFFSDESTFSDVLKPMAEKYPESYQKVQECNAERLEKRKHRNEGCAIL